MMSGVHFARKRGSRAALSAASLVAAGLCMGWLLSSAAHRGVFDVAPPGASAPGAAAGAGRFLAVPARGHLSDALFAQGLSHVAFHDNRAKRRLAALAARGARGRGAVAVVGVEYGTEVTMFAQLGYTVHAFEPMPAFHDGLAARVARNKARAAAGAERAWDVRLHQVAAGAERNGTLALRYMTEATRAKAVVRRGRVDDYVSGELAVLSVDIQGNELDVLRGAQRLLGNGDVRSLWVEIFPCNRKVLDVLRLLDERYVIFDFVPWGRPRGGSAGGGRAEHTSSLDKLPSFVEEDAGERPAEFQRFFDWMCAKRKIFEWHQSDILAVRRDLVTPQLMSRLSTLSHDLYTEVVEEKTARFREVQRRTQEARKAATAA